MILKSHNQGGVLTPFIICEQNIMQKIKEMWFPPQKIQRNIKEIFDL